METMQTIYTTAPIDYDYNYVKVVGPIVAHTKGASPKPVRKVEIPASRVDYQVGRYQSGLHLAVDQDEWNKLVAYELVTVEVVS
jgi:hypothetical protein